MASNLMIYSRIANPVYDLRRIPSWILNVVGTGVIVVPVLEPRVPGVNHLGMFTVL
jgi:hypothetical protein